MSISKSVLNTSQSEKEQLSESSNLEELSEHEISEEH